jgi:hypothetical protein
MEATRAETRTHVDGSPSHLRPFSLWSRAPEEIRRHMFDITWERADLFALPLPTETVSVARFLWQLELPYWRDGEHHFAVAPAHVRRDPRSHAQQWKRTMDADLTFPIYVVDGPLQETILDGVHRLLKASVLGVERLPCRRLSQSALFGIACREVE